MGLVEAVLILREEYPRWGKDKLAVLLRKEMPPMTSYSRGDVVLVSSGIYHQQRRETIISRLDQILAGDHLISDWREAGLLFPSVATGIIKTIKRNIALGIA